MARLELPTYADPRDNRRYDDKTGQIYHLKSYYSNPVILDELIAEVTGTPKEDVIGYGVSGAASCLPLNMILEQFEAVQIANNINIRNGKRAYHEILVFDDKEINSYNLGPDDLWNIGQLCSKVYLFKGFQCLFALHWNEEDHYHIHFVVNSISFIDGKKWINDPNGMSRREKSFNNILNLYINQKNHSNCMIV